MSTVGYATLQIIPSLRGLSSALNSGTSGPATKAGRSGGRMFGTAYARAGLGPIKAMVGTVGKLGAGLFAGVAVTSFLKDAVSQASDLNEAGTALGQTFGGAVGDVQKFAGGGAKALGQSKLEVLKAAQSFGVYGKAAGLSSKANADFSTKLVGLSTDLASFYNTDPSQAAEAIAAGLRGESEPLRQYGVLLDDATLRTEAMRQGLIKTTKTALTPQQKVLAAQGVIMKQTKDAQGDFARTSGGLANQQRILTAQMTDFKGKVGAALLPIVVALVGSFNKLLPILIGVGSGFAQLVGSAIGPLVPIIKQAAQAVADFFGGFVRGGNPLEDTFSAANEWGVRVRGAVDAILPKLLQLWGVLQANIVPAFRTVAAFVQANVVPVMAGLGAILGGSLLVVIGGLAASLGGVLVGALVAVVGALASPVVVIGLLVAAVVYAWRNFEGFRVAVAAVGTFLLTVALPALQAFGAYMLGQFGAIMATVRAYWPALKATAQENLATMLAVVRVILGALVAFWQANGATILALARSIFAAVAGVVRGAMTVIRGVVHLVLALITGDWRGALSALGTIARGAFAIIRSVISAALAVIRALVSIAMNGIKALFRAGWNALAGIVRSAISSAAGAVRSGVGTLTAPFRGLAGKIGGAIGSLFGIGQDIVRGLISGIGSLAGSVASALLNLLPGPLRKFAGKLGIHSPSRVFAGYGRNIVQGLVVGVQGEHGALVRTLDQLGSTVVASGRGFPAPAVAGVGVGGAAPLVGSLTIAPAAGREREAVDEAMWQLRKLQRGGRP